MPTSRSNKRRIIVTMGDPAGIGPEIALKALASPKVKRLADFLFIGDGFVIKKLEKAGFRLKIPFLDLANVKGKTFAYGVETAASGRASIEYLDKALALLGAKEACGLVTAPVSKSAVRSCGISDFRGHTEYLAEKTGTKDYAMMFVGKALKVTLVTRHIALRDIPKVLTAESIYRAIMLTSRYLKDYFGIRSPRIGVAGLNPHAGEGGAFGDEEARIIIPAIKKAAGEFSGVCGPFPADSLFHDALNNRFDAIIAMYHDQALAAFKMLYFKDGVNLTLGLPFIRTSPDHGTAFNIAAKHIADPESMIEAIRLACRLCHAE